MSIRRGEWTASRVQAGQFGVECENCGVHDPHEESEHDIQGGLCADCFSAMPEGARMAAGSWSPRAEGDAWAEDLREQWER